MRLVYIDEFLAAAGLQNPALAVLCSTADCYETILLQPDSEVVGNNEFIGNADQTSAHKKHFAFFQLAVAKAAHLAITPEYSTPWKTVGSLVEQHILPSSDSLWVIGCEATTPDALAEFRTMHPNVVWIVPELSGRGTRTFYDPLVYLFNTRTLAGANKIVGVVQFKTQEMADGDEFLERDFLIKGDSIYVLRNSESSTYLFTLICSDALQFSSSDLLNREQPHLILHIQLNPDPRHTAIRAYRKDLFHSTSDNKEVLCLNWAKNIGSWH